MVIASSPTVGQREFEFFAVYGPTSDSHAQQYQIFDDQIAPLMQSVVDGCNVCVMAYGQTGSGKTFSILGGSPPGEGVTGHASSSHAELDGMFPQCLRYLFENTAAGLSQSSLSLSMTELYLDDVYDLLSVVSTGNVKKCDVRVLANAGHSSSGTNLAQQAKVNAGGATIVGALEIQLESAEHAISLLEDGLRVRQTHKTLRNAASSRSHLILTVTVSVGDRQSKLVFVDLAGSERVSRSLSQGERLKEAQHINKSLSALGDVMATLSKQNGVPSHVPYRNSKLTSILQNCIGGTSKTLLFTCICPHIQHQHNLAESLSTLQFASRTKLVRNVVQKRSRQRMQSGKGMTRPIAADESGEF